MGVDDLLRLERLRGRVLRLRGVRRSSGIVGAGNNNAVLRSKSNAAVYVLRELARGQPGCAFLNRIAFLVEEPLAESVFKVFVGALGIVARVVGDELDNRTPVVSVLLQ